LIPLDDPTTLSMLFHLNSEPWLNDEAYRGAVYHQEFKQMDAGAPRTALPPLPGSPLSRLIGLRQSCRAYLAREMPLEAVAALAGSAYGVLQLAELPDGSNFLRRSVPSAGGLFPLEVYLFTQRVQGLEDGLYHYDVRAHALELVRAGNLFADLEVVLYTYPFVRDANLIFALAAVFKRTQKKYGPRGYRYILLEAGHSAQNICLAAAEQGLSTLCMGGFVDSRLNRMLNLSSADEGVVYSVAVGYGAEEAGNATVR
jgi:SagB-type dehydrogenase family enzyme